MIREIARRHRFVLRYLLGLKATDKKRKDDLSQRFYPVHP